MGLLVQMADPIASAAARTGGSIVGFGPAGYLEYVELLFVQGTGHFPLEIGPVPKQLCPYLRKVESKSTRYQPDTKNHSMSGFCDTNTVVSFFISNYACTINICTLL